MFYSCKYKIRNIFLFYTIRSINNINVLSKREKIEFKYITTEIVQVLISANLMNDI